MNLDQATEEELQAELDRLCDLLGREGLTLARVAMEAERKRLVKIYLSSVVPVDEHIRAAAEAWSLFGMLSQPAVEACKSKGDSKEAIVLPVESFEALHDVLNANTRATVAFNELKALLNERRGDVGMEIRKVIPLASKAVLQ